MKDRLQSNFLFAKIIFLFLTTCISLTAIAQDKEVAAGKIKGTVTTDDGQIAQSVTIKIKSLKKTTATNSLGEFEFKNIPFGKYLIEAVMIGSNSASATVEVSVAQPSPKVELQLQYSSQKLDEVVVTTGGNRFAKKESEDVAKLPLRNMENPQVYNVVSKELMKEQIVTDYNSAFKNVPGAGIAEVRNQGRTTSISRGFPTPQVVRNGVGSFTYTTIDPANLERVEVIKGPSATLFGSTISSFGGLFNRVTKKPYDSFGGEVSYSGGSWDLNRLTADINSPINEEKTALIRMNTALHSERSFQDAGFNKSYLIAPSFLYKVNDRLTLMIDAEISGSKGTSPTRLLPLAPTNASPTPVATSIKDLNIPYNLSFANNTVSYTSQQYNIFAQMKYKISDHWTSQTIFSRTRSSSDGYVTQLRVRSATTVRQEVTLQDYPYYGTDIQQNFVGDFKIGTLRNRVVAGFDFYSLKSTRNDATVNMADINITTPGAAYNNFTAAKIAPMFATATFTNFAANRENTYSGYVSDVLNITDRVIATAGIRIDRYFNRGTFVPSTGVLSGDYNQTAYSPKFGLIYQAIKDKVSLFANYQNGFSNNSGADFSGNTFKPSWANQAEGGVKLDFSKISATLSYYDIKVTNILIPDLVNGNSFNVQDGTQVSKGFEGELIANPFAGLNIIAGYTYNFSKITNGSQALDGLRPTTAGSPKTANLWVSYRIVSGKAQGLGIGFGGIYGSEYYQTNVNATAAAPAFKFSVPEYTILDASVFYDRPKFRIGLKVDNLTNEKYWSSRFQAQNPTKITGNIVLKF
ncbi:TonB-dependent siderophore receptor [Pedobacter aquatilis]|uniref:TonB-dependent siderophore receptor n=1 Tax=Pedobacter aquatilis TaxID=351343 RepID=UPI00292CB838|nr:TonB-dependent siderophore receptor [Pedobacter aquatilis]